MTDLYRTFGAVPVSGKVMFKLMKNGYSTLLYPGGAREALHRKVSCCASLQYWAGLRIRVKVVTMLLWNMVHPTQWTMDSSLYWDCDVWFSRRGNRHLSDVVLLDIKGGNTQALLAWAVRVCKNGCTVRLHHYSYLKFWRRWGSWCMLSYPGSWSYECGSSILLHNSWELLGTVVVLEMDVVKSSMWPYLSVETLDLNLLAVGCTWFGRSKENSIWWAVADCSTSNPVFICTFGSSCGCKLKMCSLRRNTMWCCLLLYVSICYFIYIFLPELLEWVVPYHRTEAQGEVADQPLHFPFLFPKLNPGRLYILFGKPIYTAGGFLSRPFRTSCGISLDSAVQYLWFDSICCLGLSQ